MTDAFDLGPAVDDAANVLLAAPGVGNGADRLCGDLATADGDVPEHVVTVTIAGSPIESAKEWRDRLGPGPSVSSLAIDGMTRSAAAQSAPAIGAATIEYIDSSDTVQELGRRIAAKLDDERETVVCFDSITDLQECLGQEPTFEFLHALGSQVRATGATGYYYIDRTLHDEETMTLYSTLFDAVVETGNGTPE